MNGSRIAAAFLLRIATSLEGGATLSRALKHLSEDSDGVGEVAERVSLRSRAAVGEADAFAKEKDPPWRVIAAAWEISARVGAPLAPTAERLSEAFASLDSLGKKRNVILTGPKATIFLISVLPLVAVAISESLGVALVAELSSFPGILLLAAGAMFLALGVYWAFVMVREVTEKDLVGGLELDLLWVALAGGRSPHKALLLVADTVDRFAAEWVPLDSLAEGSNAHDVLKIAAKNGMPVRKVLLAEADRAREEVQSELEKEAEKLGIRVLIPLGIFILPSFLLIGVVPMVIAMLR